MDLGSPIETAAARPGARSRKAAPALLAGLAALLGLASGPSAAPPQGAGEAAGPAPGTPESRTDYWIRARLDGGTKRLEGEETIRWTNGTADEVGELWFHLYLNAFSNNETTFFHETNGQARGGHEVKEGWGWTRVTAASLLPQEDTDGAEPSEEAEAVDLLPTFEYVSPDDGREEDRTVFRLLLPEPVAPGATVSLEIEWESQLPRVRRRTGHKDDFLLVAQWFPKLGVYEEGRGWNAHQFHASSEWYSNFGTYDVLLDLPASYRDDGGTPRVGGSGQLVSSELKGDERLMVRFLAPSTEDRRNEDRTGKRALVHDFTWTADEDYVQRQETFRSSTWESEYPKDVEVARRAFGEDFDLGLHNVDVRLLIQPERVAQAERHIKATEAALFFYGLWFGEYPYSQVTVVDPAWGARAAGGMEYPTLFTCGTQLFTTADMHRPESVTVHEAGHQFWYGLVANNEFEHAWMDEGFNSYTDSEVMWRVYGEQRQTSWYAGLPWDGERVAALPGGGPLGSVLTGSKWDLPWVELPVEPLRASAFVELWRDLPDLHFASRGMDPRVSDRRGYLRSPDADSLLTAAWEHVDRSSYGTNSYRRTAVVLRTLRGLVGEVAFLRGMRHYAETWRYRHPYPDDFFAAFQEGSGVEEDLTWYFDELFRGTGVGDWSVSVEQSRVPAPRGYFPDEETGEYVKVSSEPPSEDDDEESERPWRAENTLRRKGTLRLPIDVRLEFENGDTEELVWTREEQGEKTWLRRVVTGSTKLTSVRIDPESKVWVDLDRSNDAWFDEQDRLTPWRWAERAFSQTARYFQWFSRFGG